MQPDSVNACLNLCVRQRCLKLIAISASKTERQKTTNFGRLLYLSDIVCYVRIFSGFYIASMHYYQFPYLLNIALDDCFLLQ